MYTGIDVFDHDYSEYDQSGNELVNERGRLSNYFVGASYVVNNRLEVAVETSRLTGDVDYRGSTQSGTALTTDTDYDIDRLSLALAYTFHINQWSIAPKVAYAEYQWQRGILPTAISLPLEIEYSWQRRSLSIDIVKPTGWGAIGFTWETFKNHDIKAELDLRRFNLGKPELALADDKGNRYTVTNYLHFSNWVFSQALYFENQGFAASDFVSISGGGRTLLVQEPDSETDHLGITLSVSYQFGRQEH